MSRNFVCFKKNPLCEKMNPWNYFMIVELTSKKNVPIETLIVNKSLIFCEHQLFHEVQQRIPIESIFSLSFCTIENCTFRIFRSFRRGIPQQPKCQTAEIPNNRNPKQPKSLTAENEKLVSSSRIFVYAAI